VKSRELQQQQKEEKKSDTVTEGSSSGVTKVDNEADEIDELHSLYENLDRFDIGEKILKENATIIDFPPYFGAMPAKPVLFDLALSSLEFPNLEPKTQSQKKGSFWKFW